MSLLTRSSMRYLRRHPWLAGLSVLGVALGVAVVVAIDLANVSAQRAFEQSAERVTGRATHHVVGAGTDLDERVYRHLRVDLGVRPAAPVVEGYVTVPSAGRTYQVLGVDPFAEAPFRPYVGAGTGVDLATFMATPGTVLLPEPAQAALGRTVGDTLVVQVEGITRTLRVAGILRPDDAYGTRALENLLVMDVGTAQELFGRVGRLSRIDLILPDTPAGEAELERLRAALPPGTEIIRSAGRTETIRQMTRAFTLNLTALSLLALVVGMFLIYNTITFSVVQRRFLIGRMRALGVTRREVFRMITGEVLLIGAVGTVLGLGAGLVLAQGLVQLVTRTINDLYYVLTVRELTLAPLTLAKGVGLGLGATLLAALPPAREATHAAPQAALRRSQEETNLRDRLPRLVTAGVVLAVLGVGLLLVPGQRIVLSYVALLSVIIAFALVTPAVILVLAHVLRPGMGRLFGLLGRMAARGIVATLSRTAVAIAALMIAIAATVGVGVMVDSFRATVETWLGYSLQADVYVQPPSLVFRRGDATISPPVAGVLQRTPGVQAAYSVRSRDVRSSEGPTHLVAISRAADTYRTFRFQRGDPERIWPAFDEGRTVIVSEPYSYRHGLGVGDTLRLQTDRGERSFVIAGIFYDYGDDRGVVMMSRAAYERFFDDRGLSGLAIYAAPGQDVDALVERLRERVGGRQALLIRSNRALREASMEVFDRTFTITAVLRLLAVVVAFIGVLSALMALQLERARELAVLRVNGLTPGQLWRYVTLQTGLMGLVAGLLSLPLGLVLAYVLVFVINKRSFGWTLQFEVPPALLGQAVVVALVAAVLAGLYPAWKMARANPALALRDE